MNDLEQRVRDLGSELALHRPVEEVLERGSRLRRRRRRAVVAGVVAAVAAVGLVGSIALRPAADSPVVAGDGPGVDLGLASGWGPKAIAVPKDVLADADAACAGWPGTSIERSAPVAAADLGEGVTLLVYRGGGMLRECATAGGRAATSEGMSPLPSAAPDASTPVADTCWSVVSAGFVTGLPPVGVSPGYYFVSGRVAPTVDTVVVTVGPDRVTAATTDGLFVALLATTVEADPPSNVVPLVEATAYDDAGAVLGEDRSDC